MKKLKHSNIAQLYEVIETNELICMVLEYMSGGELFDFIVARSRLNEFVAADFYLQILNAVEYVHRLNIVHRDLKPENLLLDESQNLKLADFGLSNEYKDGENLNTPCGSPCYAAPEMVAGKSYNGLSVDIWSSGIVLYAMICGFLPFEDSNTPNLYQKIIKGQYEEPEWLSTEAKHLLKHILDTNPETRYSITEIKNHPWMKGSIAKVQDDPPIDSNVIEIMDKSGYDGTRALSNLQCDMKNSLTTLYFLLCKKKKNVVPRPPTTLSNQKIQKIHGIRQEVRRDSRPVSRIKIVAKSISPRVSGDSRTHMKTSNQIRRYIQPKEPESKPKTPIRKNGRIYKPARGNQRLELSYKSTPRNLEMSYRVRNPTGLFSP
ncbi:hypothetical protein SteCoe_34008 [Stentor coeruleus]|uniref:Protein kinase domain-containing protein n=1 Tax=Stentor coeruleus TaxID=5963 RepID=A0A1R2AVN8_9CILI|nr:hypothetical protein SteCoe_34008 [Stentor coeruleus]